LVMKERKHILCGLSTRTTEGTIHELHRVFSHYTVTGIKLKAGLHLKSMLSALDGNTIVISDTKDGHEVAEFIQAETAKAGKENYNFVFVPDEPAANVLRIKDIVIIQDGYPSSESVMQPEVVKRKLKLVKLNMSELIKADGALTCGSILMSLSK